ncbi:MAG: PaaI family thioesterase [Desulfobacteraceae bacterium]|jgi:acyl-coenzyme A thioesterase PaaI-like protein
MGEERIDLPKLQGHHCFACGTANPKGLDLHFYRYGETICTDITLDRHHEGWENVAHGGILSTLLDETMSWTIIFFRRIFFVTRKMEIKYIRPVPIGVPLTIKGQIADDSTPPIIKAKAEILSGDGHLMVRSVGEFVVVPEEKLSMVPEGLKKDMNELFERLPSP